jgi:hypothetical protein
MESKPISASYEYQDAELSMLVPIYLRPKGETRFFGARSKKDKRNSVLHFAIEFLNDDSVEAQWSIMMRQVPGAIEEWGGVRGRIVRRDRASYVAEGLESLGTSENLINGEVHHSYSVLLLLDSHRIFATFLGQGELDVFYEACRVIVSSIHIRGG